MEEQKAPSGEAAKPAPKSKALWIVIAVVVVVVVVLLAAVFGGLFGPPEESVLKIGTVLTQSGTTGLEVFGPSNLRGIQLAVKEINGAGGVLGRPIQLINEDDQGVVATARDRAQKLITTNRVDAIIGPTGSGYCAAVLELTKANGVVQMSASCTSSLFTNLTYTEGWFFRTAPPDKYQGAVVASYLYINRSFRSIGVIGNQNPYGIGLANTVGDKFNAKSGADAKVRIFAEGLPSYTSDLQALFGLFAPGLPEAVYMAEYTTDGLKILRDWAANPQWSSVKWLFSEGLFDEAGFIDKITAQGVTVGVATTFEGSAPAASAGITGALFAEFRDRYRAEYGATADPGVGVFTPNAYDAVYLIAAAAQKAGTATSAGIKANLVSVAAPNAQGTDTVVKGGEWSKIVSEIAAGRDINYEGASGSVNLDSFGDPLSAYAIWGIEADASQSLNATTVAVYSEQAVLQLVGPSLAPMYVPAYAVPSPEWAAIPAKARD